MERNTWTRRQFLERAGLAAGAVWAGGNWAWDHAWAAGAEGALSGDALEGTLAELVADLERKARFASALYSDAQQLNVVANQRERSASRAPRTAGVVFRAWDGQVFRELSTADVTPDGLRRAARELKNSIAAVSEGFGEIEPGPKASYAKTVPGAVDPAAVRLAEWRGAADSMLETVRALDPRIRSANVSVVGQWYRSLYVDRNRSLRQDTQRTGASVFLFAAEGEGSGRAFLSNRRGGGIENAALSAAELDDLKRELEDTFRAERIPAGEYHVVTTPAITGLLAHESFGHGVELDMFLKGRARAAQFLGKRVAPEFVQIWDDPSLAGHNGSYFFDDEGWDAAPTHIVKDGVFVQPLTDHYSATMRGLPRTANGRRQNYAHKAYSRMSNTFFGVGTSPVANVVGSVDRGVLLDGFQSGMEDPHGWGIQLTCRIGYEIKGGELTGRVFSPVGVTGYVPDILDSITMVGDRFEIGPGTCGKGSKEFVPVGSGGPHLALRARLS